MLKKSVVTLLFLLVLGFTSFAQKEGECEKYTDASLGISFCAPSGWTVGSVPGKSYVIAGASRDGLTPNINVKSAAVPGALSEIVDLSVKEILKLKPGGADKVELKSRSAFRAGKASGFKAVFSFVVNGINVRSVQYYFSGKEQTKIVITATLPFDADELESDVDEAVKTFAVR
jgi:hypothetical protein